VPLKHVFALNTSVFRHVAVQLAGAQQRDDVHNATMMIDVLQPLLYTK